MPTAPILGIHEQVHGGNFVLAAECGQFPRPDQGVAVRQDLETQAVLHRIMAANRKLRTRAALVFHNNNSVARFYRQSIPAFAISSSVSIRS